MAAVVGLKPYCVWDAQRGLWKDRSLFPTVAYASVVATAAKPGEWGCSHVTDLGQRIQTRLFSRWRIPLTSQGLKPSIMRPLMA